MAVKCANVIAKSVLRVGPFVVVHGDGTDLEVCGSCFDVACVNHEGNKSLRQLVVRCSSFNCSQNVLLGASDEAGNIVDLIRQAVTGVVDKVKGLCRVLALLDAAKCSWRASMAAYTLGCR